LPALLTVRGVVILDDGLDGRRRRGVRNFGALPARLVRVPAVVANLLRPRGRNVLGDLGDETGVMGSNLSSPAHLLLALLPISSPRQV
jgi:hypothetical protein